MSILKHAQRFMVPAVVVTLALTGCSLGSSAEAPTTDEVKTEAVNHSDAPVAEEVAAARVTEAEEVKELAMPVEAPAPAEKVAIAGEAEVGYSDGSEGSDGVTMTDDAVAAEPMPMDSVDTDMAEMDAEFAEESRSEVAMPQQIEPLRAGEVNDNAQWDDYLLYRRNYVGPYVNDRDISERYVIEVTDGQGYPVLARNIQFVG